MRSVVVELINDVIGRVRLEQRLAICGNAAIAHFHAPPIFWPPGLAHAALFEHIHRRALCRAHWLEHRASKKRPLRRAAAIVESKVRRVVGRIRDFPARRSLGRSDGNRGAMPQ